MPNDFHETSLLLVGHGTRDDVGTRQFLELVEGFNARLAPLAVEPAFLELAQPSIDAGVERLLAHGVNEIVTVPVILFAAGHVKRDIPGEVAAALAGRGRGDVRQVQAGHLGCHAALVELSRRRMEEVVRVQGSGFRVQEKQAADRGTKGQGDKEFECLLLVARGSSDEAAAEEMRQFAALRQADLPGVQVEVAFLAKARPSFDERLAKLAAGRYRRVIVQPHFLFAGELVERIRRQVAETATLQPGTEWIVTPPLADLPGKSGLASELLAKVILDRLGEAGIRVVASAGDD